MPYEDYENFGIYSSKELCEKKKNELSKEWFGSKDKDSQWLMLEFELDK
jgi:hypothetical protein